MNNNSYYNEAIDFYIKKTKDWVFLPTQWAMNVRNKLAYSNEEIALIMQQANMPFVYMQKTLSRYDIAYPTAQGTCRYFANPTPDKMAQFARLQIQVFQSTFTDFNLLDFSTEKTLSGYPANYFKLTFSAKNESGDSFSCLSQSWSVFYNNLAYTIGLSGSSSNFDEHKLGINSIIDSILIGCSNHLL